jgi:regulator of sirC expression with transglutaminase-like and TPR domain
MLTPQASNSTDAEARWHARAEFVALISAHDEDVPLDQAAGWMCAEERGLDTIAPMMAALDTLASGVFIPTDSTTIEAVARLNHHLFTELGFSGDPTHFDAPDNSLLDSVLQSRKGLPILLSLVMLEVGRRAGLNLHGIGFPTHFLVSPAEATPRFFVDPFNDGRVLRTDQLETWFGRISSRANHRMPPFSWWLKPTSCRQILMRMNNNLKGSYLRRNDLNGALRCVERLLILTPDAIEARRDRGLLRFELGQEEEGAKDLDAYLAARHYEAVATD